MNRETDAYLAQEFIEWIDWEGGVGSLINHGVDDNEVPPFIKPLWDEVVALHAGYEVKRRELMNALEEATK